MDFFFQMGQDEPLIIDIQHIRGADGAEYQTAAGGQRLQQQMHLGIVAQRLKMPDALHRVFNGFLVENPLIAESHVQSEALLHQTAENLLLHPPHHLHVDLPVFPEQTQLGFLFLQLPQLGQNLCRVGASGQVHPVGHDRLQHVGLSRRFRPQRLPRVGFGKPRHRSQLPGGDFLRGGKFVGGVPPQLYDLFLPRFVLLVDITQHGANLQAAAGDLHPGQAVSLRIAGDFIDFCGEFAGIGRFRGVFVQNIQQRSHAVQFQPGTEAAWEQLPSGDQRPEIPRRDAAGFQIVFQQRLVAHGGVFRDLLRGCGKVHTGGAELLPQLGQQFLLPHSGQVHLVEKQKRRYLIAFQQPPEGQGVGLHAVGAADDQHGAVQHRHDALGLGGKVHMAGGIHQSDGAVLRFQQRLLGKNGDAPCAFQRVGIQKRVLMIDPPQGAPRPGFIEHRLAERGLPRVHMGQQSGAQGLLYIVRLFCGHRKTSLWVNTARIVPQREAIVERFLLPYVISRSTVT